MDRAVPYVLTWLPKLEESPRPLVDRLITALERDIRAGALQDQSLLHGYFNPSKYYSHLGRAGLKFRLGRAFRAEYLGGAGTESISAGPYQNAWELALRNRMKFENWEFGGDYFYFRLAQSTGAFNSQGGRLALAYYF